jgi:nucleoside-diphosphate-sugar epimerase
MHLTPPIPADHPVNPDSVYAETKVACEEIVRASGLPFTIFRFAAAQYLSIRKGSFNQMRIIPPDNRIEFIHIRDIADAFLNAIGNQGTRDKTFVLAGGPRCQMLYRDQIKLTLGAMGLPAPNWSKFETKPFALDWYDTSEAQRILNFQNRTFDDFLKEFTAGLGIQLPLMRYAAGPLMKLLRIKL